MKIIWLLFLFAIPLLAAEPKLAPNAPKDQPKRAKEKEVEALDKAIAPYIAKARAAWPDAKERYLAGLPAGHSFFVTTRIRDKDGKFEQVFIAVESIKAGRIVGLIWSDLHLVTGFKRGQRHEFAEAELMDWLISKPNGTEEGNFVGNFLDTYQP